MYDLVIIGAGVVGCAMARKLSAYDIRVCVIEKSYDVAMGASKANSGIVHGGYDAKPGTLKAILNVKGNQMFDALNKDLHFGYRKCGSLVLAFDEKDHEQLQVLLEQGRQNGLKDLVLLSKKEVLALEANVSKESHSALYCQEAGVASPYEMTIALAENAIQNGVVFHMNKEVVGVKPGQNHFEITVKDSLAYHTETILTQWVINASGVHADQVAQLAGAKDFKITPRQGQYVVLDKTQGLKVKHVLFQTPSEKGKGILVTPTYHGNLMVGPDAIPLKDKEDKSTDLDRLKEILRVARRSLPGLDMQHAITSFSGTRATADRGDFIIEESQVKRWINVAGIESPGLTASPAIADYAFQVLLKAGFSCQEKSNFQAQRPAIIRPKSPEFRGSLEGGNPEDHIICRCERVTAQEIKVAMQRGIEVTTLDAIKRRTRAGMGPCQGAFCKPRIADLIAAFHKLPAEQILQQDAMHPLKYEKVALSTLKKL